MRKEIAPHGVRKEIAPHCVLPQSQPAFVIRAFALLTHAGLVGQMYRQLGVQARGLSVRLTTPFGAKKNSCLLFLRDQKRNFCGTTLIAVKKQPLDPVVFQI